jgi:hypothetical protein
MNLSDAISAENRDVEQLRGFIDEVTREVAVLQGKFDHNEELVEVFGDDPAKFGAAAAKKKLDKLEERLIAAKLRLDGAYNMFAATFESKNTTVASIAKASNSTQGTSSASHSKEKDNKFLKR